MYNEEIHNEILLNYNNAKKDIDKAIDGYKKAWEYNSKDFFAEVAFCILTPQSKAVNAWKAITILKENGLLYNGKAEEIVEYLNIVRFKNNKAKYLIELREMMTINNELKTKEILSSKGDVFAIREWIVNNIKGMGFKEANHVLRNLGHGANIAILDRHILRNLKYLNVIDEIPKTLTKKIYIDIENKMRDYSKFSGIKMDELDLTLWYKEAGHVFK